MALDNVWSKIADNLNFFRVHVLLFTFTPLIFSGIFYAANGETHAPYIDALFACVSASTVCGLVTFDLSALTGFQQAILFIQSAIGSPVVVSWVVVYLRKQYFNKRLEHIIEAELAKRGELAEPQVREEGEREKSLRRFTNSFTMYPSIHGDGRKDEDKKQGERESRKRGRSVRRTNTVLRRVDQNGLVTDPELEHEHLGLPVESPVVDSRRPSIDIVYDDRTHVSPVNDPLDRCTPIVSHRTQTRSVRDGSSTHDQRARPFPTTKNRGYGGFPYPSTLLYRLFKKILPNIRRGMKRTVTLLPERTQTIVSHMNTQHPARDQQMRPARYFSRSFNPLVGRNSKFYDLTEENLEELGGVEYRALYALLWIIATYHFSTHLLCLTIIAPYMSISRWAPVFSPPNLHRRVSPVWFSAFQVVTAYSTSGMSLVDQSMTPFQEAYPLIFVCTSLILAGYLAFPVFLRFFIWSIMKLVPNTRLSETLHFLLDHPRRCYIYLFPSRETWLLFGVVLLLLGMDWLFFMVLNIGEPVYDAIPLGVRFAIGVLQAASARAAGFATISISSLAPALQVLFVIVMYLAIYPIALSVRATNVYEEKSLGIFELGDEEDKMLKMEGSKTSFGRYLAWHARRQLSFDMWWLGLVVFLLCIIERGKIQNADQFGWFTIFAIIFEITSAYAGVGISLGLPYANYSFSGAFTPLSKLIMIVVMLRGRHRGLPVAIDRAVMLPFEFRKTEQSSAGDG